MCSRLCSDLIRGRFSGFANIDQIVRLTVILALAFATPLATTRLRLGHTPFDDLSLPSDVRSVTVGAEAIVQVDGPASTTVDSPDDSTTVNSPASMCRQGVLMPMPAKEGNKAMEMVVIDIKRGTEWAPYFCLYLCR